METGSLTDLAQKAYKQYRERSYDAALKQLRKIQSLRPDDQKVAHNIALVEYHIHESKNPDNFLQNLNHIKSRMDSAHIDEMPKENDENGDSYCNLNDAVLRFNQALIEYELGNFRNAATILEGLYRSIEMLDEHLGVRVCFLLLDIYISQRNVDNAMQITEYLSKRSAASSRAISSDDDANDASLNDASSNHSNSSNGTTGGLNGTGDGAHNGAETSVIPVPTREFQFRLYLYKTRVNLLARNIKVAKREIKSGINICAKLTRGGNGVFTEDHQISAQIQRSNLEFLRKSYAKAMKLLNNQKGSPTLEIACLNNTACLQFQIGRPEMACLFFSKALLKCDSILQGKIEMPTESQMFTNCKKMEIMYNTGICLLSRDEPALASECFRESMNVQYNRPVVWLRLAECAIRHHYNTKEKLSSKMNVNSVTRSEIRNPKGFSDNRRILLPVNCGKLPEADSKYYDENEKSPSARYSESDLNKLDPLSLPYASLALRNCLALIPKLKDPATVTSLKQIALLNLMYVSLCLNNSNVALHHFKRLLKLDLTLENKFVGQMYASESYLMLGRVQDALGQLNPANFLKEDPTDFLQLQQLNPNRKQQAVQSQNPPPKSTVRSVPGVGSNHPHKMPDEMRDNPLLVFSSENARAMLFCNLASVYVFKNEFLRAAALLDQSLALDQTNTIALRLLIFVYLKTGDHAQALRILKRRRPLPRPPR